MKRFFCCLLALMLLAIPALAEESGVQVTRTGFEMNGSSIYYPTLVFPQDAMVEALGNTELQTRLQQDALMNRMFETLDNPIPFQADFAYHISGDVLTVVMRASGPVENDRATQVCYTANIDLQTGASIQWKDLFTGDPVDHPENDRNTGWSALGEYLEYEVAPLLSPHLRNSEVTPVPDAFGLSPTGLTLYYSLDALSTLSDRAGTVNIQWHEMRQHLNLDAGGILQRIGAVEMLTLDETSMARIREAAASGQLPGIPANLGDSIPQLIEEHKLLMDPDLYESGRLIQLEDGAFRGVYLLTDSLTDGWEHSLVQGIRTDRINFHGLCTGETTVDAWRAALGQPDATVQVDEAKAESNRIVPGSSDYYDLDGAQLRLHADEEGVLRSLFLNIN